MKKILAVFLSAVLLAGCGAEKEAVKVTAVPTPGITVEKDLGRKVINAGYKTVTEEVYSEQKEPDPDLENLDPDQRTSVTFNYDAQRTKQKAYEKVNGVLTLILNAGYKYTDGTLTEVDTLDENDQITTISTLTDGVWKDTAADGTEMAESQQRDSWGNVIVVNNQSDGTTRQRTYDQNGWLTEEKVLDAQGTEVSDTLWHRYSNDELADEIDRQTASGTQIRLLNRGDRSGDTAISWYTDSSGKRYQQITDTYSDSLIEKRVLHDLEKDTYTITVYSYE